MPAILQPAIFFKKDSRTYFFCFAAGDTIKSPNPTFTPDIVGTATLFDKSNVAVPGANGLSIDPVVGQLGWYSIYIDGSTFDPPVGKEYTLYFSVTSATEGGPNTWYIPAEVKGRTTP